MTTGRTANRPLPLRVRELLEGGLQHALECHAACQMFKSRTLGG